MSELNLKQPKEIGGKENRTILSTANYIYKEFEVKHGTLRELQVL